MKSIFKIALFIGLLSLVSCIQYHKKTENTTTHNDSISLSSTSLPNSFVEGVKGITWETNYLNDAGVYYYECGRKLKCLVFYNQIGVDFQLEDEWGRRHRLDYDFNQIGLEPYEEVSFPHSDNEYSIGQYDIDGDAVDEIIVAIRTISSSQISNPGVCINFFDIDTFKLKAMLATCPTGALPEYRVRIIHNNVYFECMRYSLKYTYYRGKFIFEGEVDKHIF